MGHIQGACRFKPRQVEVKSVLQDAPSCSTSVKEWEYDLFLATAKGGHNKLLIVEACGT